MKERTSKQWMMAIGILIFAVGLSRMSLTTHHDIHKAVSVKSSSYHKVEVMIKPFNLTKEAYFVRYPPLGSETLKWTFGPALQWDVVNETYFLQDHLIKMKVPLTLDNGSVMMVMLQDICFRPYYTPDNFNCSILSVLNYFQNDYHSLTFTNPFNPDDTDYPYHVYYCARYPTSREDRNLVIIDPSNFPYQGMSCLGDFEGPIDPSTVFGGFNRNNKTGFYEYQNATSLSITFNIHTEREGIGKLKVEAWEKAFRDYLQGYLGKYFSVSFSTEDGL